MRKEYIQELEDLKNKMIAAEKFAKKLPVFAEVILKNKLHESQPTLCLGKTYKQLYLQWGIDRYLYNESRTITNRKEPYTGHLFNLYINTLSIFDEHNNYGLLENIPSTAYFFFDSLNTTFYATDDQIENLLELLNDWVISAYAKKDIQEKEKKKQKLKEELAALEKS